MPTHLPLSWFYSLLRLSEMTMIATMASSIYICPNKSMSRRKRERTKVIQSKPIWSKIEALLFTSVCLFICSLKINNKVNRWKADQLKLISKAVEREDLIGKVSGRIHRAQDQKNLRKSWTFSEYWHYGTLVNQDSSVSLFRALPVQAMDPEG